MHSRSKPLLYAGPSRVRTARTSGRPRPRRAPRRLGDEAGGRRRWAPSPSGARRRSRRPWRSAWCTLGIPWTQSWHAMQRPASGRRFEATRPGAAYARQLGERRVEADDRRGRRLHGWPGAAPAMRRAGGDAPARDLRAVVGRRAANRGPVRVPHRPGPCLRRHRGAPGPAPGRRRRRRRPRLGDGRCTRSRQSALVRKARRLGRATRRRRGRGVRCPAVHRPGRLTGHAPARRPPGPTRAPQSGRRGGARMPVRPERPDRGQPAADPILPVCAPARPESPAGPTRVDPRRPGRQLPGRPASAAGPRRSRHAAAGVPVRPRPRPRGGRPSSVGRRRAGRPLGGGGRSSARRRQRRRRPSPPAGRSSRRPTRVLPLGDRVDLHVRRRRPPGRVEGEPGVTAPGSSPSAGRSTASRYSNPGRHGAGR